MRVLAVVPVVVLLAMALSASAAFAATETAPTAGYNAEPNKPSTGTAPSKETKTSTTPTPAKETAPSTASTTPTEKASTLPFTGFDLRWDVGFGLVLMGAGFSIVLMQRRQRRGHKQH